MQRKIFYYIAILLIILFAFFLRTHYLSIFLFHIDEYFTLTAAKLIAETGLPRYPTGLFYDPGLPYSYFSGGLFWLFGFEEALGRWPAVLFSTLAVGLTYWLGKHLGQSPAVGLSAALWLTLSVDAVEWGGRARATALAQCLILVSVASLWLALNRGNLRYLMYLISSYALALLAHFSTIVLMPAWFVATWGLWRLKVVELDRKLWLSGLLLGCTCSGVVALGVIFQPPPSLAFQESAGNLLTKLIALFDKFLHLPSDLATVGPKYFWYFAAWPHGPLVSLLLGGFFISTTRWFLKRPAAQDLGAIFLGLIWLTVLFVLIFLIDPHWQRTRYLVMQLQGVFLLLSAHGLYEVVTLLLTTFSHILRRPYSPRMTTQVAHLTLTLLLTLPFIPPLQEALSVGYIGWNRYDLAATHVQDLIEDGDQIASMHPPVAWLYLAQSDYYVVQSSAKLMLKADGRLGDRYTGAAWLKTVEQFEQTLSQANRLWLITQEAWLFERYDGRLQQEILWRMDKQWGEGGVWALSSRPNMWPLAANPDVPLRAEFEGGTQLLGYTLSSESLIPNTPLQLTLFWHGQSIPHQHKVFIHLRNETNETIAQADHFIYDGKVPSSRWPALLQNDTVIRDGATLILPPELPSGTYKLIIGFYHPENFARLGVVNDQSGEQGVVVRVW